MDESVTVTDEGKKSILKLRHRIPLQEVHNFFPDDDATVTCTMTKGRRVSFGRNLVKEFMVGSAASTQAVFEYEQSSESLSDPSECSGPLDLAINKSVEGNGNATLPVNEHSAFPPKLPEERARIFTENCISIAKSVFHDTETELTAIIIGAKPTSVESSSCMSFTNLDISNRFENFSDQKGNQHDFVPMTHPEMGPSTEIFHPSDKSRFDFLNGSITNPGLQRNRPCTRTPLGPLPRERTHPWEDDSDENIPPAHNTYRQQPTPTNILSRNNTMEFTCTNTKRTLLVNVSTVSKPENNSDMEETCANPTKNMINTSLWDDGSSDDEDNPFHREGPRDNFLFDLSATDNQSDTEEFPLKGIQRELVNLSMNNQSFRQHLQTFNTTHSHTADTRPAATNIVGDIDMNGMNLTIPQDPLSELSVVPGTNDMEMTGLDVTLSDELHSDPLAVPETNKMEITGMNATLPENSVPDPLVIPGTDGREITGMNVTLSESLNSDPLAVPETNKMEITGMNATLPENSVPDPLVIPGTDGREITGMNVTLSESLNSDPLATSGTNIMEITGMNATLPKNSVPDPLVIPGTDGREITGMNVTLSESLNSDPLATSGTNIMEITGVNATLPEDSVPDPLVIPGTDGREITGMNVTLSESLNSDPLATSGTNIMEITGVNATLPEDSVSDPFAFPKTKAMEITGVNISQPDVLGTNDFDKASHTVDEDKDLDNNDDMDFTHCKRLAAKVLGKVSDGVCNKEAIKNISAGEDNKTDIGAYLPSNKDKNNGNIEIICAEFEEDMEFTHCVRPGQFKECATETKTNEAVAGLITTAASEIDSQLINSNQTESGLDVTGVNLEEDPFENVKPNTSIFSPDGSVAECIATTDVTPAALLHNLELLASMSIQEAPADHFNVTKTQEMVINSQRAEILATKISYCENMNITYPTNLINEHHDNGHVQLVPELIVVNSPVATNLRDHSSARSPVVGAHIAPSTVFPEQATDNTPSCIPDVGAIISHSEPIIFKMNSCAEPVISMTQRVETAANEHNANAKTAPGGLVNQKTPFEDNLTVASHLIGSNTAVIEEESVSGSSNLSEQDVPASIGRESILPSRSPLALASIPSPSERLKTGSPVTTSLMSPLLNTHDVLQSIEIPRVAMSACESTGIIESRIFTPCDTTYQINAVHSNECHKLDEATYCVANKSNIIDPCSKRPHSDSPCLNDRVKKTRPSISPRSLEIATSTNNADEIGPLNSVDTTPVRNINASRSLTLTTSLDVPAKKRCPSDSPMQVEPHPKRNRDAHSSNKSELINESADVSYTGPLITCDELDVSITLENMTLSTSSALEESFSCARSNETYGMIHDTPLRSRSFRAEKSSVCLQVGPFADALNEYSITVPKFSVPLVEDEFEVTSTSHIESPEVKTDNPIAEDKSTGQEMDVRSNWEQNSFQRVTQELNNRLLENECIWKIDLLQNCEKNDGLIILCFPLLDTQLILEVNFQETNMCGITNLATKHKMGNEFQWPERKQVNEIGFNALAKYIHREGKKLQTLVQLPCYLDFFNAYAQKVSCMMRDVEAVLKGCASSQLTDDTLSIRLHGFQPLMSCWVNLHLTDLLVLGRPRITFKHEMGRLLEPPVQNILLHAQKPILQNFTKLAHDLITQQEAKNGILTRRPPILF